MERRHFIKTSSLAATLPLLNRCGPEKKRPNLLFVFADQLRADTLGYTGDSKAVTPRIDRFASQSLNCSNAVSVMPVCAAYRGSLLTGKYPSSHGMVINELNMNPNHRTIAHVLGDADYRLGYIGKWHLNDQHRRPTPPGPERLGFDQYWAAYSFEHRSFESHYYTDDPAGDLKRIDLIGKHGPTEFTGQAIDYLERMAGQDRPFALFLSWNPPHDPWRQDNVPAENFRRFADVSFDLPDNFLETPDPYMDRYPRLAYENENSWKREFIDGGLEECLRSYYAMVNNLDEQFGRLLDTLERLGISDETVVVFTSDHGEMFSSQGRMYKLTFYDEAARIPMLIRYPGTLLSGKSDVCLNTPDIMPTLLGLLGLDGQIPKEVDGVDLSPVLQGQSADEPEAAFLQAMGHTYRWIDGYEWRAVRDKRFTYARYLRDGFELLFDRWRDPKMKKNVVNETNYRSERSRLRQWMADKMAQLNDDFRPCTWYRDNWMYKKYSVRAAAGGPFGPLPPIEPNRK